MTGVGFTGGEEGREGRNHHQGQEEGYHRGTDGELDGRMSLQAVSADDGVGDEGVGSHDTA